MLNIRREEHLLTSLEVSREQLQQILDSRNEFCEECLLLDPENPDKPRPVLRVTGALRDLQEKVFRRILFPKLKPSIYSHGGVAKRHIVTNAAVHKESVFVFTTDISKFYPSISHHRVYRLFQDILGCCPTVSRWLTKLCTHNHHLALGIVTSPILADKVAGPIDTRIAALCQETDCIYSRFVDDISISSDFDLEKSGIPAAVVRILTDHGFSVQERKHRFGRLSQGIPITQIRIKRRGFDVTEEFVEGLDLALSTAEAIARGIRPNKLYYTEAQLRGKIEFVGWVNPGRYPTLIQRWASIPWEQVHENARALGLAVARKRLIRLGENEIAQKI